MNIDSDDRTDRNVRKRSLSFKSAAITPGILSEAIMTNSMTNRICAAAKPAAQPIDFKIDFFMFLITISFLNIFIAIYIKMAFRNDE